MKWPGCSFLQGDCERRQNSGKKHEIKFLGKGNDGVDRTRSFDIGKQREKNTRGYSLKSFKAGADGVSMEMT